MPGIGMLGQLMQRDCTGLVDYVNTIFDANGPAMSATASFEDDQTDINIEAEPRDLGLNPVSSPDVEPDPVCCYKRCSPIRLDGIFDTMSDKVQSNANSHEELSPEIRVLAVPINVEKAEDPIPILSISISNDQCSKWHVMVVKDAKKRQLKGSHSKAMSARRRNSRVRFLKRHRVAMLDSIFDPTTNTVELPLDAISHEEPSPEVPVRAVPINVEEGQVPIRLRSSISNDQCGNRPVMVAKDAEEREGPPTRGTSEERRGNQLRVRFGTSALREYTYEKKRTTLDLAKVMLKNAGKTWRN